MAWHGGWRWWWYRGQRVFRLRDSVRATALHKVDREDGGRRRPQCAGRAFEPRTHDWAPSLVPGTPRFRQNPPDGMYVGGRYASPRLFYLFFRLLFSSAPFFLPRCQGAPEDISFRAVRVRMLRASSPTSRCTRAPPALPLGVTRARVFIFHGTSRFLVFHRLMSDYRLLGIAGGL